MATDDRTLLWVDSDHEALEEAGRILRDEACELVPCDTGSEGLRVLDQRPVDVVACANRLSDTNGAAFLRTVRERYPSAVRMGLSDSLDPGTLIGLINDGEIYRFVPKPWKELSLKNAVRACLVRKNGRGANDDARRELEEARRKQECRDQQERMGERTLIVSQEVLQKLPVPVVGVDRDGMVVLVNERAERTFQEMRYIGLGEYVRDIMPPEVSEAVEGALGGMVEERAQLVNWEGRSFHLRVEVLKEQDWVRGCVLTLEGV
jgi:two-component system NtrC family sensor kinase